MILDVKHWYDSASGLIVFTDFSSINTRSSFAGGKVPYSVAVATYGIDRHQLPLSILFNSSISTAQYENLILEMEKSEPLSKDGFVIARLSFDLKISCRKYLEGYFSGIELVDSQNISQVFEKLEFQFLNMLYRMKQFVPHNTYNELRETYKFGSYEIKTRDKEKNNIEMESQLRDHKRLCLKNSLDTSSGASKLLFNRMAPDSQMANFDSQSTQKPAHELLSSDFYFESMPTMTASRHEGMLTPNLDSEDKSQNVTAQDKSPLSIKNIQMPPPKTPLRPVVRSLGAALYLDQWLPILNHQLNNHKLEVNYWFHKPKVKINTESNRMNSLVSMKHRSCRQMSLQLILIGMKLLSRFCKEQTETLI